MIVFQKKVEGKQSEKGENKEMYNKKGRMKQANNFLHFFQSTTIDMLAITY